MYPMASSDFDETLDPTTIFDRQDRKEDWKEVPTIQDGRDREFRRSR
jgi:hypothetical protein